jgi:hypothetical protein
MLGLAMLAVVHRDTMVVLGYCLPFAWLVLVPVGGEHARPPRSALFRVVLAFVAVLMALWAFPIAGTQAACAKVFALLVLAVCAGDALAVLSGWWQERFSRTSWLAATAAAVVLLVAGHFTLGPMAVATTRHTYLELTPCGLRGAARVRMEPHSVEIYRWLVASLEQQADCFTSLPGFNSLYLWTGQAPPTGFNTTTWMTLLDHDEQLEIVARLAASRRAAVVYSPGWTGFWTQGRSIADQPLVRLIETGFRPVERRGDYWLMLAKETAATGSDSAAGEEVAHQGQPTLERHLQVGR